MEWDEDIRLRKAAALGLAALMAVGSVNFAGVTTGAAGLPTTDGHDKYVNKNVFDVISSDTFGTKELESPLFDKTNGSSDITDLIKMQINDNASWTFKQKQFTGTGVMQTGGAYMPDSKLYYMIPNDDSVKENLQAIKDVLNGK